jgi:4-amino-4-deoxy-L-arabinose transferase-like glycosyltransferase
MALTLLCFAAAERHPERRRTFLTLMYVCVGLGVLTKGPVAAVLPALVFLVYLGLHRELKRIATMMVPGGLAIVLAIVVPWYAALYRRDGWTNIVSFIVGENLERFTSGLGVRVERGPFFYLPVVFSDSFPWALFLVPAAILWWRERRGAAASDAPARIRRLLWLWILVIVGFFSLSAGKQDLYIFPIVPAVTALAGWVLARALDDGPAAGSVRASVSWTTGAIGFILLVVGVGLIYLVRAAGASYAIAGVAAVGVIGVLFGAAAIGLAARQQVVAATLTIAIGFVALNAVFVWKTLPSFEAYKPVPAFARSIGGRAVPGDIVATYDQSLPSLVFYLRRHVVELLDPTDLGRLLESGKGVYTVMAAEDYPKVREQLPGPLCVIDRQPTFDVRLKNVLAREPLPELVLVTNRCGG